MNTLQSPPHSAGWSVVLLCLLGFSVIQNLYAATNQAVYAVVTELTGWAIARSTEGEERELTVGSELYSYEMIVTGKESSLVAKGPNGTIKLLGQQMLTLFPSDPNDSMPDYGYTYDPGSTEDRALSVEVPVESVIEPAAGAGPAWGDIDAAPVPSVNGHLLSARDFLISGRTENSSYPLYSYLLFNREDLEGSVYQRRVAAIQGYLALLAPVAEVSTDIAQEDINIFYLPLKAALPDVDPVVLEAYLTSMDQNQLAKHILDNYDFSHARVLLHRAGLEGDGPFIVTISRPLSKNNIKPDEKVITQDLSHVPPELVKLWVQQFKYEAARWRSGESSTLRKFALNLRTEISVLAEAFRITNEAVAAIIKDQDDSD